MPFVADQPLVGVSSDVAKTVAAAAFKTLIELEPVSQVEAEAGVATTERAWTAERVGQAIAALGGGGGEVNPDLVPQAEAEAGTASTERVWSAERNKQALDALGILLSDFTVKGQLLVATGSGSVAFLGVGANDEVLTADSAEASGMKWAAGGGGGGLANIVEDVTPQLGSNLDTNAFFIDFDTLKGIRDESGNEQLIFITVASAVNYLTLSNGITNEGPTIGVGGGSANPALTLAGKGVGAVLINPLTLSRVGVGTPSPQFDFHVDRIDRLATLGITAHGSFESPAELYMEKRWGTRGSEAATGDANRLGVIKFRGWTTGAGLGAEIEAKTVQVWSTGNQGTELTLRTVKSGTNSIVDRITLTHDGALLGFGLTDAAEPAVSSSNNGTMYFNRTDQKWKISENGGAYINMDGT